MKGYPDAVGSYNQYDGDRNHDTAEDRPRDVAEGQAKTLNGKKKRRPHKNRLRQTVDDSSWLEAILGITGIEVCSLIKGMGKSVMNFGRE
jgi:hypothetical protein